MRNIIDTYILDEFTFQSAIPGDSMRCPVANCISEHNEYTEVCVTRTDTEYTQEDHDFSKCNTWPLTCLIWAIDQPETTIKCVNFETKEETVLFSKDKRAKPPYKIIETENYFHVDLTDLFDEDQFWVPIYEYDKTGKEYPCLITIYYSLTTSESDMRYEIFQTPSPYDYRFTNA